MKATKPINPKDLSGPRSFFTDIDPRDPDYQEKDVERKLKLQLLTKEKIVIAASSLFHEIGYNLFSKNEGLTSSLENGIILPAIRNQFEDIKGFFEHKKEYSTSAKSFFINSVSQFVPWDLDENSSWFRRTFYNSLRRNDSVLREKINISEEEAQTFLKLLDKEINQSEGKYLNREQIDKVGKTFNPEINFYLNSYANLIYRISGARVVNSEGHFPQSNLTRLGIVGDDNVVSDESIFWDIYVESVINFLNSAARLTPERLDRLSFTDILIIRKNLFNKKFAEGYDKIISLVKEEISISDPEKLILKQAEINEAAKKLREEFSEKIRYEFNLRDYAVSENALWQVANILTLISDPTTGLVIGCLSGLNALPEITAAISKPLAQAMQRRLEWIRECINSSIPATGYQKRILLDGYRELITYGLP